MKVLSLFSGIGAFEKALKNIGQQFELVGFSEIDKYAVKSYCAIHEVNESMNLGDITKIDEKALPKDIDLITYGFPCQDISLAGKQKGLFNEDGSQTRSGLFFEALRIIEETRPKIAIAENVKNLVGKKFNAQFQIVLASLEAAGYNNYWQVLNAKDYGIPQNRERVFIVSIRKDIDIGSFKFPEGFPLELRLKDLLEDEVDEKFYLSEKIFNYAFNMIKEAKGIGFSDGVDKPYINPEIAQTIGCRSAADQRSGITNYVSNDFDEPLKVADMKDIIFCREQPRVLGGIGEKKSNRGSQWYQQDRFYDDNLAISVTTRLNPYYAVEKFPLRIRKLTPKECFRLMGFTDEDFAKAEAVNSNTQLYKQAGNSIVVDVIAHIFTQLKAVQNETISE